MSTANKLNRILQTKNEIKQAINNSEVVEITNEPFKTYPDKINEMVNSLKETKPYTTKIGNPLEIKTYPLNFKHTIVKGHSEQDSEPTPENPSEIKNVEGIENLFNANSGANGYISDTGDVVFRAYQFASDYIKVKENKTYVISVNKQFTNIGIAYFDNNKKIILPRYDNANTNKIIKLIPSGVSYIRVWFNLDDNTQLNVENMANTYKTMVTINDSVNFYVPYGNKYLPINVSGKNLYNYKDLYTSSNVSSVSSDGWVTANFDNTNGSSTIYSNYFTNLLKNILANTEYSLILEIKNVSGTGSIFVNQYNNSQFQYPVNISYSFTNLSNNSIYINKITSKDNLTNITLGLRTFVVFNAGQSGSITYRISVIENTSITSETFKYEPYYEPKTYYYSMMKENLFDKNNPNVIDGYFAGGNTIGASGGTKTIYVKCKPNTTYTVSKIVQETTSYNRFNLATSEVLPAVGTSITDKINNGDGTTKSTQIITTGENANYLLCYIWASNSEVSFEEMLDSIKIYEGVSSEDYYELCKIGDIKDELDIVTGKIIKRIGKLVLDGSETWVKSNNAFQVLNKTIPSDIGNTDLAFSNYFKFTNVHSGISSNIKNYEFGWNTQTQITIKNDDCSTPEEFKVWLKEKYDDGTPVEVYYELAEPYEIDLKPFKIIPFDGTNIIKISDKYDLIDDFEITYYTYYTSWEELTDGINKTLDTLVTVKEK